MTERVADENLWFRPGRVRLWDGAPSMLRSKWAPGIHQRPQDMANRRHLPNATILASSVAVGHPLDAGYIPRLLASLSQAVLYRYGAAQVGLNLSFTSCNRLAAPFKTEPSMPAAHTWGGVSLVFFRLRRHARNNLLVEHKDEVGTCGFPSGLEVCIFRGKVGTHSDGKWALIPSESGLDAASSMKVGTMSVLLFYLSFGKTKILNKPVPVQGTPR
uniref:Uncharacterized protein n=1 Tax=Candidatus Kentrum sp. UNK TaxID=2126344 RepID=A0A450ZZ97_9GAMM|nr:MAG: hypothetical protein BECKUNK1418G_GA0071005_100637 [Candidatus Kentron sp. UNK]